MLATVVKTRPLLVLDLPATIPLGIGAGRFFLARAEGGDTESRTWETYLRRTLFPVNIEPRPDALRLAFQTPAGLDPGYHWLLARQAGDKVDLLGPYGNGFDLAPQSRNLLLVADAAGAPLLLPLAHAMLDRGGRVTLLLRELDESFALSASARESVLAQLPIAVEVRPEADEAFVDALCEVSGWADQVALCLPMNEYSRIAHRLRAARFRLDDDYAQALVITPLPCGCGACLGCLVSLAHGGFTRACVHGPVFDLKRLG